jgi:hypothetical protein
MPIRRSESPLHEEEPECVDSHGDSSKVAIEFIARDGRIHGFPYSQLVNYLLDANPAAEGSGDAPPERLTFQFSSHDVVITGWRLNDLRPLLHAAKIATIFAADSRYRNLTPRSTFISEIVVTSIKGAP